MLVVEDDRAVAHLLEALLTSAGFAVRTAMDGPEALTALDDRPDAVLLDVTLPDMTGWDVLAAVRALPAAPPVLLLTGDRAALRRARQAGAAQALLKPFDIDEVLRLTRRLFAGSAAEAGGNVC
ncbi:MAG: response regulator [Dehalococcoidia bacterium]